jgi:hypothetical protein
MPPKAIPVGCRPGISQLSAIAPSGSTTQDSDSFLSHQQHAVGIEQQGAGCAAAKFDEHLAVPGAAVFLQLEADDPPCPLLGDEQRHRVVEQHQPRRKGEVSRQLLDLSLEVAVEERSAVGRRAGVAEQYSAFMGETEIPRPGEAAAVALAGVHLHRLVRGHPQQVMSAALRYEEVARVVEGDSHRTPPFLGERGQPAPFGYPRNLTGPGLGDEKLIVGIERQALGRRQAFRYQFRCRHRDSVRFTS